MLGTKYKVSHTKRHHDKKTPNVGRQSWALCDVSQVSNMLDDLHPARDFHSLVKPAIDNLLGHEVTFDILFHNSEHQATLLRYGVKKSAQVSRLTQTSGLSKGLQLITDGRAFVLQIDKIYKHIMPAWKKLFDEKKLWRSVSVSSPFQPLEGDIISNITDV